MSRTAPKLPPAARQTEPDIALLLVVGALTLIALLVWIWRSAEIEVGPARPLHVAALQAPGLAMAPHAPTPSALDDAAPAPAAGRADQLEVPKLPSGVIGEAWRDLNGDAVLVRADGSHLTLTLTPALQRPLEKRLRTSRVPYAGVIVLDATTFAVRAWAEKREPNDALGADKGLLRSTVPAGATLGIATVAAALESGLPPTAQIQLGDAAGQPGAPKSACRLDQALRGGPQMRSCLGEIGVQHLTAGGLLSVAEDLGFGASLPFDVDVEASGFVIGAHERGLRRAAAGLGEAALSPLHAAVLAATLGHGGEPLRPALVAGDSLQPGLGRKPMRLGVGVPPAVARQISAMLTRDGAELTVGCAGEAWPAALGGVRVASFETHIDDYGDPAVDGDGRLVSWFLAVAPADRPTVAVAAVAVNRERWHLKACTLGREALINALTQQLAPPAPIAPTASAPGAAVAPIGAIAPSAAVGLVAAPAVLGAAIAAPTVSPAPIAAQPATVAPAAAVAPVSARIPPAAPAGVQPARPAASLMAPPAAAAATPLPLPKAATATAAPSTAKAGLAPRSSDAGLDAAALAR